MRVRGISGAPEDGGPEEVGPEEVGPEEVGPEEGGPAGGGSSGPTSSPSGDSTSDPRGAPIRGSRPDARARSQSGVPQHLTFEVTEPYGEFVDDSCDAAVVALLPVAMKEGKKVRVSGPFAATLDWRIRHTAVPVLTRLIPNLRSIAVEAADLVIRRERPDGAVMAGLSCGVDSFVACRDFLLEPSVPEVDRITHFLFTEIGSHGDGPGLRPS